MSRNRWFILLILAWSVGVHLPKVTSPLLDFQAYRQTQTAASARHFARNGMAFFSPEVDDHGPLQRAGTEFPVYSYLVAVLYKLFGLREILGRLLSIAFTAWASVFLFRLVERRLGTATGVLSALAMNAIPVHLYFSRTFMPDPMALWGVIGFANFADLWFRERRAWALGAAILCGATAPLLKLPYLYIVLGLWAVFMIENRRTAHRPVLAWAMPAWILGLTAAWYAWANSAPAQIVPTGLAYHVENLRPILTARLWRAQFISRFPELATTYAGLLLGLIGLRSLWRREAPGNSFLFLGWWAVMALYTPLTGEYGLIHRYTLLPWAPINAVFIGAGLVALWRWSLGNPWRQALTIVLALAVPVHAGLRVKHWYWLERLWVTDAKALLDERGRPEDLVFTATHESPVYLYYLDRRGWSEDLAKITPETMDGILARGVRWAVIPVEDAWRDHPAWAAYFTRKGRLTRAETDYLVYEIR